jgi:hypothetical protein
MTRRIASITGGAQPKPVQLDTEGERRLGEVPVKSGLTS